MKRSDVLLFNKKALSTIVATLIIILLVLVATGIIWVVVRNVIQEGSEQVSLGKFTLDLELKNVEVNATHVSVQVKRNPGEGEFVGLNFILDDGSDTIVVKQNASLHELEQKKFVIGLGGIPQDNLKSVSVAPVFRLESGKEVVGDIKDEVIVGEGVSGGAEIPSTCGNGELDSGEDCDGTLLDGETCTSQGFDGGSLSCSSSCTYVTSSCTLDSCGNGQIDSGEDCDGTNLNGGSCVSEGFDGGSLSCSSSSCQYITSSCTLDCGNGQIDSGEDCDGTNLNGGSCVSEGFDGGSLSCSSSCTYVTSSCTSITCGNGINETGEVCDDGDTSNGDGCSSSCTIESGWSCSGGSGQSTCEEIVGDDCSTVAPASRDTCCVNQGDTYWSPSQNACVGGSAPSWQTGLVSWWRFEGNAEDYKGSNDGTVVGASPSSDCIYESCYDFDGSGDYIDLGDLDVLTGSFTISTWAKFDNENVPNLVSKYNDGGGKSFILYSGNSAFQFIVRNGDVFGRAIGGIDPQTGTWYNVVGVYDGSAVSIYVNGVLDSSSNNPASYSGGIGSTDTNFFIGAQDNSGADYEIDGRMDEVMIWNRALSSSEISNLYSFF